MNLIKTLSNLSIQRSLKRNAVLHYDRTYRKKIKVLPLELENQCDSLPSEESMDSEGDSVNMLVDDALRGAAKHSSPTTTRKKNSKPTSSKKVPSSQESLESRKSHPL
ncbi:hypothetical protein AVEN_9283-1 [Araneus ventricosus]|uniref:Uncharacterized protein n=1 Tax=Araneus ventricosus TaxID=182803 RepID=A0A4Y2MTU7_ARAVE|nr:hypothetical protein AVEN_9283-1 [Araneus ventricosus]